MHSNFLSVRWKPFSKISFLMMIWCSVWASGCAKLAHLQELLTLKELSEDRDQQDVYTQNHDAAFERLLSCVNDNSIDRFPNKEIFLKEFGKPILIKSLVRGEESLEEWLYRYAARNFGSPKVYVYFTLEGNLQDWEFIPRDEGIPYSQVSSDTISTKHLESQSSLPLQSGSLDFRHFHIVKTGLAKRNPRGNR